MAQLPARTKSANLKDMSVEELKKEIAVLSGEERHELSAFLADLEIGADKDYWTRVRERLEDKDASHWVEVKDISAKG